MLTVVDFEDVSEMAALVLVGVHDCQRDGVTPVRAVILMSVGTGLGFGSNPDYLRSVAQVAEKCLLDTGQIQIVGDGVASLYTLTEKGVKYARAIAQRLADKTDEDAEHRKVCASCRARHEAEQSKLN